MLRFILFLAIAFQSQLSYSEIYKWVDENGKVHFSDSKPSGAEAEKQNLEINTYSHVSFGDAGVNVGQKVVMYSTEWCTYCKKARKYFKKNNIQFVERDIEKSRSAKKQYEKIGGKGVPVILVGEKRMNGFSEKGFLKIYSKK